MRKFEHKSGRIAEYDIWDRDYTVTDDNGIYSIPAWIIEDSEDWKEITNKKIKS